MKEITKLDLRNLAISYADNHWTLGGDPYANCIIKFLLGYIYGDDEQINKLIQINFKYVGKMKGDKYHTECCHNCKYADDNLDYISKFCNKHYMSVDRENVCDDFSGIESVELP